MERLNFVWVCFFVLFLVPCAVSSEELISVIVLKNEGFNGGAFSSMALPIDESDIEHRYSSFEGFSAKVNLEEYESLKKDSRFRVFENKKYRALLDVSVPQVNANDVWGLQRDGINLTGEGQTICIIDTGVNYSHPNLGGCYGDNNASSNCKVLGGWDYVNGDNNSMDDHGHGTHVAGIIISNDTTYKGTSPGSKIISIKALDSGGVGDGNDIIAGIDWCVSNASTFNITVISMSLGDCSNSSTYCDGSSSFTSAINAAIAKNISVVVASGNGNVNGCTGINVTFGLSDPACVQNATAVGGVDDSDIVYSTFQRWGLFQLMAPGVGITSTNYVGGGFNSRTGTSMSTPHVAGVVAILKQLFALQSDGNLTSNNAKVILNNTGTIILDSASGRNYSRIDFLAAVLNQDRTDPNVSLVSPLNGQVNMSQNRTFSCNASDWQIENVTFKIWNSSGLYYNSSANLSGTTNGTTFSLNNIPYESYSWNCFYSDSNGNLGSLDSNYSLVVGGVSSSLNRPQNNSYTRLNQTVVNCSAQVGENSIISNTTVMVWNGTGLYYNSSTNLSGTINSTNFTVNLSLGGDYIIGCRAYSNLSYSSDSTNSTIHYDLTGPSISSVDVGSITSESAVITWTTNEEANSSVEYDVSGNSSSYTTSHSISLTNLSANHNYGYYVKSCDRAGNCETSSTDSFRTSTASSSSSSSSSSTSSSSESGEYMIADVELSTGKFNKLIKKDDIIYFRINGTLHRMRVLIVSASGTNITVSSEPFNVTIPFKGFVKLNLSSSDYYDIQINNSGIANNMANVTIYKINEKIVIGNNSDSPPDEDRGDKRYTTMENDASLKLGFGEFNFWRFFYSFLPTFIIIIVLIVTYIISRKSKKLKAENTIGTKSKDNGKGKEKEIESKAVSKR